MVLSIWLALYALILVVGGLIGHLKAASFASLVMGLICGALTAVASWMQFKEKKYAREIALLLCSLLTLFFAYRFSLSYRMMPSGMMAILSLISTVACMGSKKSK